MIRFVLGFIVGAIAMLVALVLWAVSGVWQAPANRTSDAHRRALDAEPGGWAEAVRDPAFRAAIWL